MFYTGDLQSGIAKALQEGKLLTCFVTDDGDESQVWETEYLKDESLLPLIAEQTILLRLEAGSQEAGYLAAIFPLPKNPTLVIIKNGELKEYLAAGVSKEDFMRRMHAALGSHVPQSVIPGSSPTPHTVAPTTSSNRPTTVTPTPPVPSHPSPAIQDLLAERSARLEAQKKEQDARERAARAAEAKARREAVESSTDGAKSTKLAADLKYASMEKKRQQDARDERARILKRVEDDKAERREKEASRRAQAKALAEGTPLESSNNVSKQAGSTNSKECAIQIRMFDGSTIRSRFPSSGSLLKDVRPWIDAKQEGDNPYTFKQVLTPMPNKNIETSEEEQSLQALGLTPSATLILLPVTGFTSAYSGDAGYISKGVSAGYGLVSSGAGIVSGLLGSLFGGGATPPAPAAEERTTAAPSAAPGPSVNVRTLRDQRDKRDDQQFYNGNALNFEPRKDDDKKED